MLSRSAGPCHNPAVFSALFPNALKMPQRLAELFAKMIPKGGIMSVSDTMALTLLVTGSISFYILLQAAINVLRQRKGHHGDQ